MQRVDAEEKSDYNGENSFVEQLEAYKVKDKATKQVEQYIDNDKSGRGGLAIRKLVGKMIVDIQCEHLLRYSSAGRHNN